MNDDSECKTLIFKRFPPEITEEECVQFLKSLGATSVNYVANYGSMKHCAYAEFCSNEAAWNLIRGLHMKKIMNRRLAVEFVESRNKQLNNISQNVGNSISSSVSNERSKIKSSLTAFAPIWDLSYTIPTNLFYDYPPANVDILTNIVRSMVSCPALYNQVLHLMNRLHLPPPFGDPEQYPGKHTVVYDIELLKTNIAVEDAKADESNQSMEHPIDEIEEMDLSSGTESELSSENGSKDLQISARSKTKNIHQKIRRIKNIRNWVRNEQLSKHNISSKSQQLEVSDLFEAAPITKKLNLNVPKSFMLSNQPSGSHQLTENQKGFGLISSESKGNPVLSNMNGKNNLQKSKTTSVQQELLTSEFRLRKADDSGEESTTSINANSGSLTAVDTDVSKTVEQVSFDYVETFSLKELKSNCLSLDDRQNYSVFARGYTPGTPTSRLYIKNLAQTVTEVDLYRIFGSFSSGTLHDESFKHCIPLDSSECFSIRLLTEGRMKGQAFVGLSSESTAAQALEATNGYMLYGRPMVVQFARGAKGKVDDKSLLLPASNS